MSLRSQLGDVHRSLLCALYRREVPLGDLGPIVSFTFDDFPRTAYSAGGAILERFGARGTYYVTIGLMNGCNELGELFNADDLRSLMERGHDLGTHTYQHSSCRSMSVDAFREDVIKGKRAVEELASRNSVNFAYPYGHVSLRAKKTLGPDLASCRSIVPGCNGPDVDLNLLRANSLCGDVDQSSRSEALIRENVKRKSWLIFYTHDVRSNASRYGCTPALFESVVSHAARSGSRLLTVRETLAELQRLSPGNLVEPETVSQAIP